LIPYGRQQITQADIDAVVSVLRSDFLTQGPKVPEFEEAVARYCGAAHGVAANSATSALHIACMALGLGPGDRLWTSPITFVASANCALYCGATVDFVDIDPRTWNLDPAVLQAKLEDARTKGTLPKIVVPVHFGGQSCDMRAIHSLSREFGFRIIEDASHAIGGRYLGEPVGNCRYSDITVFSFHPVKIMTTLEGGMATTNDAGLAAAMALYRSHGVTRDPAQMKSEPDGPWYYEQVTLGYNYRMTDVQAALGTSQLTRVDAYVARRHELAARYESLLDGLPLQLPWQHPDVLSALHLFVVRLRADATACTRLSVFESMREAGVGVNVHYIPVYEQPYFKARGHNRDDFPASNRYYAEALTLPLFPAMTMVEQDHVVAALRSALS
jgi:UDP-4-amino-4,6-dideoxy-N-acetyl-beta-L-altrosamine transaminase